MTRTRDSQEVLGLPDDPQVILGEPVDASTYLRQADVVVENKINPKKGTTLSLTLAQFNLDPGGGEWKKPGPSQGEEIRFGGNPGHWTASNTQYPGDARGSMVFAVQTKGKLRLDFHSTLASYGATINGASSSCWVNGFLFTLQTSLNPETSQPIFRVQAVQYSDR